MSPSMLGLICNLLDEKGFALISQVEVSIKADVVGGIGVERDEGVECD